MYTSWYRYTYIYVYVIRDVYVVVYVSGGGKKMRVLVQLADGSSQWIHHRSSFSSTRDSN